MKPGSPVIPVLTGQSVLSRTAGPFEVTLVEHRAGLDLPRHRHREAVIGLLLRGEYEECVDRRMVHPARASLLIKPPETPHSNRIGRNGTHTVLVQLRPELLPADVGQSLDRPGVYVEERICRIGELLLIELHQPDAAAGISIEALVLELLDIAQQRIARRGTGCSPRQSWLLRARDYVNDHASEPLTLTELANAVGVHRAHLARAFRTAFGCTVGEYVRAVRLHQLAEALRRSDRPLAQLAAELGFYDQAHLTRCFRRAYGESPAAFRRARLSQRGLSQAGLSQRAQWDSRLG